MQADARLLWTRVEQYQKNKAIVLLWNKSHCWRTKQELQDSENRFKISESSGEARETNQDWLIE